MSLRTTRARAGERGRGRRSPDNTPDPSLGALVHPAPDITTSSRGGTVGEPPRLYAARTSQASQEKLGEPGGSPKSGEGGIRTLERGLCPSNALAGRRLQPLGHFSARAQSIGARSRLRYPVPARRGGRAVECGGLENRYGPLGPSRVQIPPPPLDLAESRIASEVPRLRAAALALRSRPLKTARQG